MGASSFHQCFFSRFGDERTTSLYDMNERQFPDMRSRIMHPRFGPIISKKSIRHLQQDSAVTKTMRVIFLLNKRCGFHIRPVS